MGAVQRLLHPVVSAAGLLRAAAVLLRAPVFRLLAAGTTHVRGTALICGMALRPGEKTYFLRQDSVPPPLDCMHCLQDCLWAVRQY